MIKNYFRFSIIFLWLFLVSIFYYNLFPLHEIIRGLPNIGTFKIQFKYLTHIFILFLYIISANGWGRVFWKHHGITHLEKLCFATGAGLGILSLLILLANFFGITNSIFYFIILLVGFILFIFTGDKVRGKFSYELQLLTLFLSIPLISTLIGALAPPTQYDSLAYHLSFPLNYLRKGKMYPIPDSIFSSFPQNMEMLYQSALALDRDILANLLHWLFLPLTSLSIFLFSRRFWNTTSAIISSAIWLFTPSVLFLATGTYVDLSLTYYIFMSFYSTILFMDTNLKFWLYSSAFFSGIALGTKYTAVIPITLIFILVVFSNKSKQENNNESLTYYWTEKIKNIFSFILIVFILFAPWLVKNISFLNNPIAPWGSSIFTKSLITKEIVGNYFNHIQSHGFPLNSILDILLLPWKIVAYGFDFGAGFDILGPVFILFIPILFFKVSVDKLEKIILLYTFAFCTIWLTTGKVLRFLMPIIPFLCLLSAQSIIYLSADKLLKRMAFLFLGLSFIHNILVFHWVMAAVNPYSTVLEGNSRETYLTQKLNYYNAINNFVNNLSSKSKILCWGETRGYYFPVDTITPTPFNFHPLVKWVRESDTTNDLFKIFEKEKITHIFVNNYELNRLQLENKLSEDERLFFNEFKKEFTNLVFKDKYCEIYKLN